MKIVIMGSGGVGGYFGARLALGGADVTFVARGANLAAMRENGLTLDGPDGLTHVKLIHVVQDPHDAGVADFVFVAVKLWDTGQALRQIAPIVGPHTAVVSFQNGVLKERYLADAFPAANLMGGVCYIATRLERPGAIKQTGPMQRMQFGEYDGSTSARAQALPCGSTKRSRRRRPGSWRL